MLKIKSIDDQEYVNYIMSDVMAIDDKKNSTVSYYAKKDSSASAFTNSMRYFGTAFKDKFGLEGSFENDKEKFVNMFDGKDPHDPTKLLTQNSDSGKARKGWDLTFSACKELSILIAHAKVTGNKELEDKLLRIHRESVNYALSEIEKNAVVRRGKGGREKQKGVKLFVFQADHFDSRPVEGRAIGDPQLHTHAVTMNYALAPDGKIICLDGLSIAQQADMGTANYRMMEAKLLQEAGFKITNERFIDEFDKPMKRMNFKVQGVSEELKEKFSKRHQDIDDFMKENGGTGNYASLSTRNSKNPILNFDEIKDEWKKEFEEVFTDNPNALELDHSKLQNNLDKEWSDEQILEQVHRNKNRLAVNEFDIRAVITEMYTGYENAEEKINDRMKSILSNREDLCVLAPLNQLENEQYCSMKLVLADLNLRSVINKQNNNNKHFLKNDIVEKSIKDFQEKRGFELTEQQLHAVKLSCGNGGISVVEGRAGVGKSTSAEVTCGAYRESGYTLMGISVSNVAAQNLESEAGFPSVSMAKFLNDYREGKINLNSKTVIYFDEFGMCGLEMASELATIVNDHDCKLILAGDSRQLSSVEAGSALKVALEVSKHKAKITKIVRQKEEDDRKLARDFYEMETQEDSESLFDTLIKKGRIKTSEYLDQSIEQCADAYVKDPASFENKLASAERNESVIKLNKSIQRKLIDNGLVGSKIRKIGHYTYCENDRVMFTTTKNFGTKKNPLKVINGTKGRVLEKNELNQLRVQLEDGRIIVVPEDMKDNNMELAFALTIYRSQGLTRSSCHALIDSNGIKNALALVQFTRLKDKIGYYGPKKYMDHLRTSMHIIDRESGVLNLLDESQINKAYERYHSKIERALKEKEGYEALNDVSHGKLITKITNESNYMREITIQQLKEDVKKWDKETEEHYEERLKNSKPFHSPAIEIKVCEGDTAEKILNDAFDDIGLISETKPKPNQDGSKNKVGSLFNLSDNEDIKKILEENGLTLTNEDNSISIIEKYSKTTTARRITVFDDKTIGLSYDAMKKDYSEKILGLINKNEHFDRSKMIEISVNEKLGFFKEEEQKKYLEKIIINLVEAGHPIANIRVSNEKHKDVIDKLKENYLSKNSDRHEVDNNKDSNESVFTLKEVDAKNIRDVKAESEFAQFIKEHADKSERLMVDGDQIGKDDISKNTTQIIKGHRIKENNNVKHRPIKRVKQVDEAKTKTKKRTNALSI